MIRMAPFYLWIIATAIIMTVVVLSSVPGANGVSYPLQRGGLLPVGKKVGESLQHNIKTKKSTKPTKRKKTTSRIQDLKKPHHSHDHEKIALDSSSPEFIRQSGKEVLESEYPTYKAELYGNVKALESLHPKNSSAAVGSEKRLPYYDCPLFSNGNAQNGKAIIRPDPFDCGCCYYCNWGVHHVQCCSWPLLWNHLNLSCDWYWKVNCDG